MGILVIDFFDALQIFVTDDQCFLGELGNFPFLFDTCASCAVEAGKNFDLWSGRKSGISTRGSGVCLGVAVGGTGRVTQNWGSVAVSPSCLSRAFRGNFACL